MPNSVTTLRPRRGRTRRAQPPIADQAVRRPRGRPRKNQTGPAAVNRVRTRADAAKARLTRGPDREVEREEEGEVVVIEEEKEIKMVNDSGGSNRKEEEGTNSPFPETV